MKFKREYILVITMALFVFIFAAVLYQMAGVYDWAMFVMGILSLYVVLCSLIAYAIRLDCLSVSPITKEQYSEWQRLPVLIGIIFHFYFTVALLAAGTDAYGELGIQMFDAVPRITKKEFDEILHELLKKIM